MTTLKDSKEELEDLLKRRDMYLKAIDHLEEQPNINPEIIDFIKDEYQIIILEIVFKRDDLRIWLKKLDLEGGDVSAFLDSIKEVPP